MLHYFLIFYLECRRFYFFSKLKRVSNYSEPERIFEDRICGSGYESGKKGPGQLVKRSY